ncbi:MAG: zinc-ribbon domain-containing protein [Paracoccus sp. (in: a-proteobacteria)]|uniref:zinc-ribbon domain-containing protein n=1 Tax=Paracoccus sp. TaxID=267 RepID=UPI0026E0A521|nr:zinc-ribbon domain-containing protein [Paracoccus sp. (in: a-proteobacteria)]MDO5633005.1 zinc-ribbon domain-containing protein [Paracoccus sp. (in: a-proteobacteria)]
MGEIRLICPGCGAEYRLDEGMIPAQGREVECSACGHIWHQPGSGTQEPPPALASVPAPVSPQAESRRRDPIDFVVSRRMSGHDLTRPPIYREQTVPPAPPTPAQMPRLNRPLPADVLAILTEEAERERAAQAAEQTATTALTTTDWPATTLTTSRPAEPQQSRDAAAVLPPAQTERASSVSSTLGQNTVPLPAVGDMASTLETVATAPEDHADTAAVSAPPPPHHHGRTGFVCGLLVAALLLALYLAAPLVPAETTAGQALNQWREIADQARAWLAGLF